MKNTMTIAREEDKEDILQKLVTDFWSARKLIHKNLPNASEQAYQKIAAEAREGGLLAEARIADAAMFELKGRFEEAIWCLKQVINDSSCQIKGIANFLLGSVYKERFQDQPEKAIYYYEQALEDKQFDKPAWAKNNLGNIYFRLASFDHKDSKSEAAKHYKKAAAYYNESLTYQDPDRYITHYNQGRLALGQKKYPDAILRFDEAISLAGENFDLHGCCYREMGTAHILNNLDKKTNTIHDALNCWEIARKRFDEADKRAGEDMGKSGKSAVALAKMRVAKVFRDKFDQLGPDEEVLLRWWPPEESGADGYSTPEERIFSMIEATGRDRYQLYNTRESSRFAAHRKDNVEIPAKDVLAFLRGWGSASPLIEDAFSACVGGGYFLKWRDKGLVIDPGFDFMRNFRSSGFHMREVDAVLVSHDHTDHNADLRSIEDVFYEMYRRSDEDQKGDSERHWHYYLICDEQTKEKDYLRGSGARHRTILEMTRQNLSNDADEITINLRDKGLPFIIHYFRAQHGSIPAFCIRIDCLSAEGKTATTIGFTCDTQYFEGLNQHLKGCNILVAHVSQPTLAELLKSDKSKDKHLGYRGVSKLVKGCQPDLTILGEFWAGFADMRIDITKGLKRTCDNAAILPSSVGLFVTPKEKQPEIECSSCRKWRAASSIYVGAANHEYGPLAYLCPLCRI